MALFRNFISKCCEQEKCYCGQPAEHKVEETIFFDDPMPNRHPLTIYICHEHFNLIMGKDIFIRVINDS